MRKISKRVKDILLQRENKCSLKDDHCDGHITWEHSLIYAGKQIDEPWAIVFLCEYHHSVGKYMDRGALNKEKNVWVALNQATEEDLKKYSKVIDYKKLKETLNKKYGEYNK